jgi:hypothetical protein
MLWHMVIIETSIFTKQINSLLKDDEYRALQNHIVEVPNSGDIIKGSGGIRKLRWQSSGHGKRGGARIIYFWATSEEQIFMLYAYPKKDMSDLSKDQLSILKKVVYAEFKNER